MPEPIGPEGIPPDLIALFVQHASPGNYDETAPSPIGPLLRAAIERGLAAVIPMIEARVLERLRPADMNLVVRIVRHEGPTSELFIGFDPAGDVDGWIAARRTPAWTMVQVAPLIPSGMLQEPFRIEPDGFTVTLPGIEASEPELRVGTPTDDKRQLAWAFLDASQKARERGEPLPDVHEFTAAWKAEHARG